MENFQGVLLRLKEQLGVETDKEVAELLGMTVKAFTARKSRGSFPEDKLLALVARRPELLLDADYILMGRRLYEETAARTAAMMEAARRQLGVTDQGSNAQASAHLTADELELLELFRAASLAQKMEAVAVLSAKKPLTKGAGIKVSGSGHRVAGRDFNERKE